MAIQSLYDLSELAEDELYAVYLAIAQADHRLRVASQYGTAPPPTGHWEFRPLAQDQFLARLESSRRLAGGELLFRQRLARQATVYGIDVPAVMMRLRTAA